jgi:hypothetical protein
MPTCVNLKERFGQQYRVTYEESYHAERGKVVRTADPWLMIVPCRYGHVYPYGGENLAASVDGYPKVAGVLRRLPCCRVHQDGDFGELTVLFDVADFDKVAKIIRPRHRRQLSTEERKRLSEIGEGHRFQPRQPGVQSDLPGRSCVPAGQDGSEPNSDETGAF